MFLIRPARSEDLQSLAHFAYATTLGMLSLPKDARLLEKKLEKSLESFEKEIRKPQDEHYLFVLENLSSGRIEGSSGVYASSGTPHPLYFYRIEELKREGIEGALRVLHPETLSHGPSELCSLYLAPHLRGKNLGTLLSLSRFLYIAENRHRFKDTIIAVLRGVIDKEKKTSPFWNALGRHFFSMTFEEVQFCLEKGREFVPRFFPKYPVYASLLSKQAQNVIGKPQRGTRPALDILKREGFFTTSSIDIFDAGPKICARTDEVSTVKSSREGKILAIEKEVFGDQYIACSRERQFRACLANITEKEAGVVLRKEDAELLEVAVGGRIRYAKLAG